MDVHYVYVKFWLKCSSSKFEKVNKELKIIANWKNMWKKVYLFTE